jgi:ribosome biogenesis GTPase
MRELGNIAVDAGISETFEDIERLSIRCKFTDCTHTDEVGCAIIDAKNNGTLNSKKYDNYIKLKKETAFYQMSYLEKRKRDKSFGKMVKRIMKNNRKK